MKKFLSKHSFLRTLIELRGNPRACVYTEPMWGLSMNLCLPYASVYMLALGLNDVSVGVVASIYMFSQTVFAFLSGVLVDKMGRRLSTLVFDLIAWSVPCLIWAPSQGFLFFAIAAILNGTMKVSAVSWACLLVEDAPKDKITHIYTWIMVCANLSALFAPISSILVARLTLVPAIRILYINAFVIMTAKILLLYKVSTETAVGKIRREESRHMSWRQMLSRYKAAARMIFTSRATIFAIVVCVLVEIVTMFSTTFWQIIASRRIGVPDILLPVFPMAKNFISILLFFTVVSRIKQTKLKIPLYGGFLSSIIGCVLLISITNTGVWGYVILSVSILFESLGSAILTTLKESLIAIHLDPEQRSGIMALIQTVVMLFSVPFGYIGGLLSDVSRAFPFVLSIALLLTGIIATAVFFRKQKQAVQTNSPA